MNWTYRGKRIRPSDKNLLYHFKLIRLLPILLSIILLFYHKQLFQTNWKNVSLIDANIHLNIPYLMSSLFTALFVCLLVTYHYYHYRIDHIKQLQHRQKLARMILENGWYESEQVQSDSFFKDLDSSKAKEKIHYFPKIYYRLKDGLIHIQVEITMGKYQEQLLRLEKKLETGLYCELTDKILKDSYVEYTLLYDTINSRITIDDVQAQNGQLLKIIPKQLKHLLMKQ